MSSIMDLLTKQLGGQMGSIGQQLGTDADTTKNATGAALSTILGALARNSSQGDGAKALHKALEKDHDGGVLDDLPGFLNKAQQSQGPGEGILKHILGGKRGAVEAGLSGSTGMNKDAMGKLMNMLAPVVMGALGKQQRQEGMGADSLSNMLGTQSRDLKAREPKAMGVIGKLLDQDGDGDVDLGDLAKGVLGKFLGR